MTASRSSAAPPAARTGFPRWLLAAFALTLAASAWFALADDGGPDSIASTPERPPASRDRAVAKAADPPTMLANVPAAWPSAPRPRRAAEAAAVDAAGWSVPPPPAAPPSAPAAPVARAFVGPEMPQAPAFAYTLIGRLDDGQPRALLTGPLRSFDVRVGDLVDGQWRVEAVTAEGLVVTWLPGGQRRQIGFQAS